MCHGQVSGPVGTRARFGLAASILAFREEGAVAEVEKLPSRVDTGCEKPGVKGRLLRWAARQGPLFGLGVALCLLSHVDGDAF